MAIEREGQMAPPNGRQAIAQLREDVYGRHDFCGIVAHSRAMLEVLALIGRVAGGDTTVLITGDSGTGKELLAAAVHRNSRRARGPFVSINCAAIPDMLLESELFGYRRGAFTGAALDKAGLLMTANGGTLFLDEVADLPSALQPKLLRFLQDGSFYPLGALKPATANVRVVAATNAPLDRRVADQTFREDLYYRLSTFPILVPPLRDRLDDIVPLARHVLSTVATRLGRTTPLLSRDAIELLFAQEWRGNVRELAGALERALVLDNDGVISAADLRCPAPSSARPPKSAGDYSIPDDGIDLPALTRGLIAAALQRQHYNIAAAARMLGISRPVLRYRIKKYGLRVERLSQ